MRYLTIDEVLVLHAYQIEKFGGNSEVLDIKLLESALARPQTTLSQEEMFPTIYDKAAILAFGIIDNHPFVDGNKRTGIHSMLLFLELNGIKVSFRNEQLTKLGKDIARNNTTIKQVVKLLKNNTSQHHS